VGRGDLNNGGLISNVWRMEEQRGR
jgi:hypothetical protein